MSRSRTLRGVLAIGAASLVLAACTSASTGPVATVDGVEVPRALLEGWVRTATDANADVDAVGLQADLLARVIQQRIIDALLAERGLTVDPALLAEIRESITAQVGGALSLEATLVEIGFPQDYFDDVFLAVEASVETLVLSLVDGRTLETRTARHILVSTAEEADEIVARARKAAETHEHDSSEEARAKRAEMLEQTRRDIDAETRRAIEEIRSEVANLTVLATEKVTGRVLTDADQQRLVDEALGELDFSAISGERRN